MNSNLPCLSVLVLPLTSRALCYTYRHSSDLTKPNKVLPGASPGVAGDRANLDMCMCEVVPASLTIASSHTHMGPKTTLTSPLYPYLWGGTYSTVSTAVHIVHSPYSDSQRLCKSRSLTLLACPQHCLSLPCRCWFGKRAGVYTDYIYQGPMILVLLVRAKWPCLLNKGSFPSVHGIRLFLSRVLLQLDLQAQLSSPKLHLKQI